MRSFRKQTNKSLYKTALQKGTKYGVNLTPFTHPFEFHKKGRFLTPFSKEAHSFLREISPYTAQIIPFSEH